MIKQASTSDSVDTVNIQVDRQSGMSLTDQIVFQLKAKISSEELTAGAKLPSATVFAKDIGVAYKTMESALSELSKEGYLKRIKNKGTFVANRSVKTDKSDRRNSLKDYRIKILLPDNILHFNPNHPPLAWFNFIDITNGIVEAASQLGIVAEQLYVADWDNVPESIYDEKSAVFMFSHTGYNVPILKKMKELGIPYVVHAPMRGIEDNVNAVIVNVKTGAYDATCRLLEAGYDDLAFICRLVDTDPWFIPKLEGVKQALTEHGIDFSEDMLIRTGFDPADVTKATEKYLDNHEPSAIFALTDLFAHGALTGILQSGLRVPEDIALVGYDDLPTSSTSELQLSAVRFPRKEIGRQVVKMLSLIVEHPETQPLVKTLGTEFIGRETFVDNREETNV